MKMSFPKNCCTETGGPKNYRQHLHVRANFDQQCFTALNFVMKHHAPQHHLCQCPSVCKVLTTRMVLSAEEFFAIDKMAVAGMGNKKIATTLGVP